jgi:hypothetical protein
MCHVQNDLFCGLSRLILFELSSVRSGKRSQAVVLGRRHARHGGNIRKESSLTWSEVRVPTIS